MLETICTACMYGDHSSHIEVISRPPEGMLGGTRCRCKGECTDGRYIPPQFKNIREALMQNLKEEREANPWGTKLIISVYFKGFVVEEGLDGVIDDIDQIFPESDFIGISSEVLYEEPKEQEGG